MKLKRHTTKQIKQDSRVEPALNHRSVKEISTPVKSVVSNASVEAALHDMRARGVESSSVVDQSGVLLGSVSKHGLLCKVGGLGHDPKAEQVRTQLEKSAATCFDDQSVSDVRQMMLDANVEEVSLVTHEALLVGTTSLAAIAQLEGPGECSEICEKSDITNGRDGSAELYADPEVLI